MHQRWHDLLFMHWRVDAAQLRPLIPAELELDLYDGSCWVGVVPFWMSNVRPRFVPPVPGLSRFIELNVRTYVKLRGKPGVWFFSLDASNSLAVWAARMFFHLPYFRAVMEVEGGSYHRQHLHTMEEGWIDYTSTRTHKREAEAVLKMQYRPVGLALPYANDELAWWLSARFCLYTAHGGRIYIAEIDHPPWLLQSAEANVDRNTMAAAAGITLPAEGPLLHFSRRIDVRIWPLRRCGD